MIYVVSDLHGYQLEKFKMLLKKANFNDSDYCFILGDVIDRGENGVELLEWLMYQPNIQLILGNHEAMMLSCSFLFQEITESSIANLNYEQFELYETWMENGGKSTIEKLAQLSIEDREAIIEYVSEAPLYDTVEINGCTYILTHSGIDGFDPQKRLNEYEPDDFLWNRPLVADKYFDNCKVVFGHTPTHFIDRDSKGKILVTDTWIDIDTGAACGLLPTLLRLDDMEVFAE